jgi:hypothetical protein
MTPADDVPRTCLCCQLQQPAAIDGPTGVTAPVCGHCTHHQGDQGTNPLRRAKSHEAMLRKWLEGCRASEAAARKQAATAKAAAEVARQLTADALASRGRLAARIIAAADSGRQSGVAALAHDADVIKWARRAEQPGERHY